MSSYSPSLQVRRLRWTLRKMDKSSTRSGSNNSRFGFYKILLVPKGGLEPPHPCEYMDLNHARLPIPPLRQSLIPGFRRKRLHPRTLLALEGARSVLTLIPRFRRKRLHPRTLLALEGARSVLTLAGKRQARQS